MRAKLRSQNPSTMKMSDLDDIIKGTKEADKFVKAKLDEVEKVHHDIEERKRRWNKFENESEERDRLIGDFKGLLAECEDEYKRFVAGCGEFDNMNNGFLSVNSEMKDHPDYNLKQQNVGENLEKYNKLSGNGKTNNSNKAAYGSELEKLRKINDPATLKNIPLDQLVQAITSAGDLLNNLQEGNSLLDVFNDNFGKDRQKLNDADIYEIQEKKNHELKGLDQTVAECKDLITSIDGALSHAKETGQNTSAFETQLGKIKSDLPQIEADLQKAHQNMNEISELIQNCDLENAELPKLAEIIKKLKDFSKHLNELAQKIKDMKKALKMIKDKLSGMDSEKKLNDLLAAVLDQKRRCQQLNSDIDQLIKLAQGLDGYTSDDEEAFFVEGLVDDL